MKKVLFLIILFFAATPVLFAQRSTLRVSLSDHSNLDVALDNKYFNKHGTSLTIGDLPAGRHYLKVYSFERGDRSGRGYAHLLYEGNIRLHRGTFAECIVDPRTGEMNLDEQDDYRDDAAGGGYNNRPQQPMNNNRQYDDNRDERDHGYNDIYENSNENAGSNNASPSAPAIGSYGTGPMSQGDMDGLKAALRGKDNDADKVQTISTELSGKSFTTAQVLTMMKWLKADDSKLQLAQWAYPQTTDKEKYNKLAAAFSAASYKKQLSDYIDSRK